MKKLKQYLLIILIVCFITQCSAPDFSGCYTCKKRSGGYNTSGGYVTTYDATLACSDEAAESMESKGWDCEGYNNFEWSEVDLIRPVDLEKYVSIPTKLTWVEVVNFFPNLISEITYDIYLDKNPAPNTILKSNHKEDWISTTLAPNTTYYWKVVGKNQDESLNESVVRSFTTRPNINYGTFIDGRDGNIYKNIMLGTQTWMAENLRYEIPNKQITDGTAWKNNSAYDAWCYYNNDNDSIGQIYGILYQFEAAKNACPNGWHLPSYAEWQTLRDLLVSAVGEKLKETGVQHWNSPNSDASNSTGFTALPGGKRYSGSSYNAFNDLGKIGYWWLSNSSVIILYSTYNEAYYDSSSRLEGSSVRCIKD